MSTMRSPPIASKNAASLISAGGRSATTRAQADSTSTNGTGCTMIHARPLPSSPICPPSDSASSSPALGMVIWVSS